MLRLAVASVVVLVTCGVALAEEPIARDAAGPKVILDRPRDIDLRFDPAPNAFDVPRAVEGVGVENEEPSPLFESVSLMHENRGGGQHSQSDDVVPASSHDGTACSDLDCWQCRRTKWDLSQGLLSGLCHDSDHRNTGFIDFNYYWDTREFNVLTINSGAKLPYDFEYFQLLNLFGAFGNGSELENWTGFFTEINLRRPIAKDNECLKHLDWTVQWADGSGPREVLRLGVRWRFNDTPGPIGDWFRDVLKLKYSIDFHVIEDDGSGWQIEHVYRRDFFDGLIYIGGFADHNINGVVDSSDWVAEAQIGFKLCENFYAVAEHRYFSFTDVSRFKQGWGFGLEYVVNFR